MPQTYYGILGVALEASDTEIRTAYKQALLRLHPDKVSAAGAPADNQRYQELQTAWAVNLASGNVWQKLPSGLHCTLALVCVGMSAQ